MASLGRPPSVEDRDDLALIPVDALNDDAVTECLRTRHGHDQPYTDCGTTSLVSMNPGRYLALLGDEAAKEYARQYRDASDQTMLAPHIFSMATKMYLNLRRLGQDQAVVLAGVTGSGKSETHRALVRQLCWLAAHSKKDAKMHAQVQKAQTVLEGFGNTRTATQPNASRYSLFEELQFNERGRVVGAKFLAFGFEKSRLLSAGPQERSFHALYYMLAGATAEERQRWQLRDASAYAYLRGRAMHVPGVDDARRYQELVEAMRVCGIKSRARDQVFQLLSAILHLGELQFEEGELPDDACVIQNHEQLEAVATLLGVTTAALETALTHQIRQSRNDVYTVFLNPAAACVHRDQFACTLYSLLFAWLVECLNQKLCREEETVNIVALLDSQGFRAAGAADSGTGNYEAFLANFSAERIQAYASRRAFEGPVDAEMRADGIQVPRVLCVDNAACVELLRGKHNDQEQSVISTLDIESAKSESRRAEAQLVAKLNKHFSSHGNFARPSVDGAWSIAHFAGQVTYVDADILEKNLDAVSADLVKVCRESKSPFIAELFSSVAVATETNPRDARSLVAAQQNSKPMRAPSRRVKRAATRKGDSAALEEAEANEAAAAAGTGKQGVARQLDSTLEELFITMDECRVWVAYHVRPSDADTASIWGPAPPVDAKRVRTQVRAMLLPDLARQRQTAPDLTISFPHDEFLQRYNLLLRPFQLEEKRSPREKIGALAMIKGWSEVDAQLGSSRVFLRESVWKQLEDALRQEEKEGRAARKQGDAAAATATAAADGPGSDDEALSTLAPPRAPMLRQSTSGLSVSSYGQDSQSVFNDDEYLLVRNHPSMLMPSGPGGGIPMGSVGPSSYYGGPGPNEDTASAYEAVYNSARNQTPQSAAGQPDHLRNMWGDNQQSADSQEDSKSYYDPNAVYEEEEEEEEEVTKQRRCWVCYTWALTWWIPECCITKCGRMKRADVRMAWREKVAICIIIFLMCAISICYVLVLPILLCPKTNLFTVREYGYHQGADDLFVAVHGTVYDVSTLAQNGHGNAGRPVTGDDMLQLAGTDVSPLFPLPLTEACPGIVTNKAVKPRRSLEAEVNFPVGPEMVHSPDNSFARTPDAKLADPKWYWNSFIPGMRRRVKGQVAFNMTEIQDASKSGARRWVILGEDVIDLSGYFIAANSSEVRAQPKKEDWNFLGGIEKLVQPGMPVDITEAIQGINPQSAVPAYTNCLRRAFKVGVVDVRQGIKCLLAEYLLLATAVFLCLVILAKFLAALQLGTRRNPEEHDKFVICQVPCYTEGEESLQRAFESLAALDYDDKRKLIFAIADGMIVGSGNDRPTPRIVLDLLGVDPKYDPAPLPFRSVGEGANQLNYGKVYSGLYEHEGHVVPYLVVVKVGRPTESRRPGNRGKRDSQIVLMRFLNRVHFDRAMAPLELEMYHQLKNVIGVHPSFYEYILMVDADTQVAPQSLNRLISCMVHDQKVMGICGETRLANEDLTWATMIQVYEYYISHHLAKAFESLFGSVTCLPGCFCMYRVRTPVKNRPLIIADDVVNGYSDNNVDTLHKKNLLSLGEDRYLTTLMLKHFPQYKMTFTPDAFCDTAAPEKWSILLSQRRRWINSTIHNLVELLFLKDLCGFCCFSMRFVVMIDLLGTVLMPATLIYIGYLLYLIIDAEVNKTPLGLSWVSLVILGAVYGLQAIIFLLKRQWQHIGWMIIYLLAMPLFGFALPLYSFWHFDDFSWGNTRVVVGENKKKKKVVVGDEEVFDPRKIPLRTWTQYEQDIWEKGTSGSQNSHITSISRRTPVVAPTESVIGSQYAGSQYGGGIPAPSEYRHSQAFTAVTGSHYGSPAANSTFMTQQSQHAYTTSYAAGGIARSEYEPSTAFGQTMVMNEQGGQRYSMHSAAPSQMMTPYGIPPSSSSSLAQYPTDDQLVAEIRTILSTSDLMAITKKQVREQLNAKYGVDLSPRKEFINSTIDRILQGQL